MAYRTKELNVLVNANGFVPRDYSPSGAVFGPGYSTGRTSSCWWRAITGARSRSPRLTRSSHAQDAVWKPKDNRTPGERAIKYGDSEGGSPDSHIINCNWCWIPVHFQNSKDEPSETSVARPTGGY